jgi:pseudaminic acid synthase
MFKINGVKIGKGQRPYIIAELSANHGGSIDRAKDSIKAAKNSGADAVKIQTYTPDTMTLDSDKADFLINDGLWKGYNLYQLYKEAYTPFEWHSELFECARKVGITLFSTPFDETAADLLDKLETPAFKIASFEITDLPLIEYVSSKQKPMLMSTGLADINEIGEAVETCFKTGNREILLFHCISNYPVELTNSRLGDIQYISDHFDVEVGLSDHTTSNIAAMLSVALGATAIEKHFKLDDADCGPDSSFSILPQQLKSLCEGCYAAYKATVSNKLKRSEEETSNKKYRRSLYFVKNLKKGDIVSESDIRRIRPGYGLEPKHHKDVIGRQMVFDVSRADPVTWDALKKGD